MALYSHKLSLARLELYAINVIAPQLEQVPGISFVNIGGSVTPAYEVVVNPARLAAANLTLNDIINTLQNDNQRVAGGFAFEPNRQTTLDIRGDIQNLDSVRNLAIIPASPGGSATAASSELDRRASAELPRRTLALAGSINPWSASNSVIRIGDVATVTESYEPRRNYAHISGDEGLFMQVRRPRRAARSTHRTTCCASCRRSNGSFPRSTFSHHVHGSSGSNRSTS